MGTSGEDLFPELYRCVGEGEHGNLHAQLSDRNSACIAFADRDLSSGGICIPIFLMLNNWDKTLRQLTGGTFFLNNLFVLALVYASTALPFTIYLLSGYFRSLAKDFEEVNGNEMNFF